ncbi:hypothetical protein L1887_32605 [Cichorium endivia]|nr:hypothetical protein L1887_32605 [Cichorium endivia]
MFHLHYNLTRFFLSNIFPKMPSNNHLKHFYSTIKPTTLSWEGSSRDILLKNLETSLKNHQLNEAWESYTNFKKLHGLPNAHLLNKLITEFSYSVTPKWLQIACDITLSLSKEKSNIIHVDHVRNLSLSLARAQMPIPTSKILRTMIEQNNIPPNNILGSITLHMVKKEIGTYLASNILIQICDNFRLFGSNKPDTVIFNLVLEACSSYNLSFKAEKIIELMAEIGVTGDAYTIINIARIHVVNGQRDELKKFKNCVDDVAVNLGHHYFQFYDCLMSLHFKFNDIDSASKLILEMINRKKTGLKEKKPFIVPIGSQNLKMGLKLRVLPHFIDENLMKVERNEGLVMYKSGKFVISNNALAKLVLRYKRQGRVSELSNLLWRIETENGLLETKDLIYDVIDACIHVGWLETAHDILDDTEKKGDVLCVSLYASLLRAYYESNKHREVEGLLKQIKKAGIIIHDVEITKRVPQINDSSLMDSHIRTAGKISDLAKCLVKEMREVEKDSLIYEFNSSIYFFTKAKMIDDALKTYKSMKEKKVYPTMATYMYMVMGYSSLEMYREITILWGDIKRSCDDGNVRVGVDLYEVLIVGFLKGGYFERVMEVIGCMKKDGMYADKWFYKSEFLKLHKGLYRNLKLSDVRSEAQCNRLAYVKAFRKWASID